MERTIALAPETGTMSGPGLAYFTHVTKGVPEMRAIRPGDLYFLESPFHMKPCTEDTVAQEKKLSYLLGTCSSRPAVVIRGPSWWDRFNTVTVIPSLSHGDPAITFRLQDRYGHLTEAPYPFIPHNPHTLPVSRLGKFIGSLEPEELRDLLQAFHWIHDPSLQADPAVPVPKVYADVVKRGTLPTSWHTNRDARANVDLTIDAGGVLSSENHPEMDGFPICSGLQTPIIPDGAKKALEEDVGYVATENPLPDTEASEGPRVPVERSFPPSMFTQETLNRVAFRFTISDAYYNGDMTKRAISVLTPEERVTAQGELTSEEFGRVLNIYTRMTAMDARLLGPRLPINALADACQTPKPQAVALKRVCNILGNLSDDEYLRRSTEFAMAEKDEPMDVPVEAMPEEVPTPEPETPKEPKLTKSEIREISAMIRPYMNSTRIYKMPDSVASQFLRLSMALAKRTWSGPNFKDHYALAKHQYRERFKET